MLGIHGIGRDGADYYLSDRAPELPGGGGPGHWAGRAAEGLGLSGPVEAAAFCGMLEGRHPRRGTVLGSGRTGVAAFDLTFSAPKSASVLFGLGGPEVAQAIVDAHEEAVAGSIAYLERHALTATRRSGAARTVVPTSGAVAAVFTHGVSRNGDPHLHSHVVLANLVHGADGRWSATDRRGIHAHRAAAAAVYEAGLRAGMTASLGVRWAGGPGRSAEVVGIGPELLGAFSSRSADIRRQRDEWGVRSARGARTAWAATRPPKAPGADFRDLAVGWQREALAVAAPLELPRTVPRGRTAVLDEHRFAGIVSLPAHGGAHRRDVVAAFGTAAVDGAAAGVSERFVSQWVPSGPVGVAEPLCSRRSVLPANHQLRALGPRPIDPAAHDVWRSAARALDGYRERWGLQHATEPLGEAPSSRRLGALPAARLADHLRTARTLQAARVRLGFRDPMEMARGR